MILSLFLNYIVRVLYSSFDIFSMVGFYFFWGGREFINNKNDGSIAPKSINVRYISKVNGLAAVSEFHKKNNELK